MQTAAISCRLATHSASAIEAEAGIVEIGGFHHIGNKLNAAGQVGLCDQVKIRRGAYCCKQALIGRTGSATAINKSIASHIASEAGKELARDGDHLIQARIKSRYGFAKRIQLAVDRFNAGAQLCQFRFKGIGKFRQSCNLFWHHSRGARRAGWAICTIRACSASRTNGASNSRRAAASRQCIQGALQSHCKFVAGENALALEVTVRVAQENLLSLKVGDCGVRPVIAGDILEHVVGLGLSCKAHRKHRDCCTHVGQELFHVNNS